MAETGAAWLQAEEEAGPALALVVSTCSWTQSLGSHATSTGLLGEDEDTLQAGSGPLGQRAGPQTHSPMLSLHLWSQPGQEGGS